MPQHVEITATQPSMYDLAAAITEELIEHHVVITEREIGAEDGFASVVLTIEAPELADDLRQIIRSAAIRRGFTEIDVIVGEAVTD